MKKFDCTMKKFDCTTHMNMDQQSPNCLFSNAHVQNWLTLSLCFHFEEPIIEIINNQSLTNNYF